MRQAVMSGSRRLSYLEAGEPADRVLLLLHAFPLTAEMWRPQLLAPPRGWRLLAPDLAGLGSTDDQNDSPALDDYVRDVAALLDRLDIPRAAIGGLSLGGYVALAVARTMAPRVERLVLADTKAPADTADQRAARDRLVATLDAGGADAVAAEMLPRLLGETTRRERPELVEHVRSQIAGNPADGIRRAILRLRDRPDASAGLAEIAVPTLVIVGDEDVPTPIADARALASGIAAATLEVIPGSGHLSNLERPEAFNAVMARFLAS